MPRTNYVQRVGRFTSENARRRFLAAYDEAMRRWPEPRTEFDVETRYGTTHLVRYGDAGGPPIVLLHGAMGNSSNWFPQVPALGRSHTVYSVDTIDDPGRSVQRAVVNGPREYAAWLDEVLSGLGAVHLVGFSYGGFLALCAAVYGTTSLKSVTLLDPGGLAAVPARFFVLIALQAMALTAPRPLRSWLAGPLGMQALVDYPEQRTLILAAARGWRTNRPAAPRLDDDELRSIRAPLQALIAGRSILLQPDQALARIERLIPHGRAEIVPGAHGLSLETPDLVNQRILHFLTSITP